MNLNRNRVVSLKDEVDKDLVLAEEFEHSIAIKDAGESQCVRQTHAEVHLSCHHAKMNVQKLTAGLPNDFQTYARIKHNSGGQHASDLRKQESSVLSKTFVSKSNPPKPTAPLKAASV